MLFEQQHWLSAFDKENLRSRIRNIVAQWTEVLHPHQASLNTIEYRWQWNANGNLVFVIKDSGACGVFFRASQLLSTVCQSVSHRLASPVPPPTRFLSELVDIAKQRTSFESAGDYHWVQAIPSYE
jgi:hypothetical protein